MLRNTIKIEVIKAGDPECEHEWESTVLSLDTLPPVRIYRCKYCEQTEAHTNEAEAVLCEA